MELSELGWREAWREERLGQSWVFSGVDGEVSPLYMSALVGRGGVSYLCYLLAASRKAWVWGCSHQATKNC